MIIWILIGSVILLTGFKKNTTHQNILLNEAAVLPAPVKVSIASATTIKGDKGQKPVKVMVYLSQAAAEPVTVKYNTKDSSAKAGVDYVATKGSVRFEPGEVVKWITVFIIGEVAADPDEDAIAFKVPEFIIMITEATGVIIDAARAYITILQNIAQNPSIIGATAADVIYEVMISYTGYTSFAGDTTNCPIRKNGVVVLSGVLYGVENVGADDDILYTGTLEMIMDIDICSIGPGEFREDEHRFCGITVNGSGKVYTELEIQYDSRGGYIKIENKDGQFIRTVTGSCDGPQKDEEWTMVPNETIASVFNGTELPMLTDRTLRVGSYTDSGDMGVTVVEVLRKIR